MKKKTNFYTEKIIKLIEITFHMNQINSKIIAII